VAGDSTRGGGVSHGHGIRRKYLSALIWNSDRINIKRHGVVSGGVAWWTVERYRNNNIFSGTPRVSHLSSFAMLATFALFVAALERSGRAASFCAASHRRTSTTLAFCSAGAAPRHAGGLRNRLHLLSAQQAPPISSRLRTNLCKRTLSSAPGTACISTRAVYNKALSYRAAADAPNIIAQNRRHRGGDPSAPRRRGRRASNAGAKRRRGDAHQAWRGNMVACFQHSSTARWTFCSATLFCSGSRWLKSEKREKLCWLFSVSANNVNNALAWMAGKSHQHARATARQSRSFSACASAYRRARAPRRQSGALYGGYHGCLRGSW